VSKLGGLETKVPQRGPRVKPSWRSKARPPEADKNCENDAEIMWSTEHFTVTTNAQTLYNIFRGQISPLPLPAGTHGSYIVIALLGFFKLAVK